MRLRTDSIWTDNVPRPDEPFEVGEFVPDNWDQPGGVGGAFNVLVRLSNEADFQMVVPEPHTILSMALGLLTLLAAGVLRPAAFTRAARDV